MGFGNEQDVRHERKRGLKDDYKIFDLVNEYMAMSRQRLKSLVFREDTGERGGKTVWISKVRLNLILDI
jgi:hypothetical protein